MRRSSPSISGALAHVHCSHYAEGLHFSAFHYKALVMILQHKSLSVIGSLYDFGNLPDYRGLHTCKCSKHCKHIQVRHKPIYKPGCVPIKLCVFPVEESSNKLETAVQGSLAPPQFFSGMNHEQRHSRSFD